MLFIENRRSTEKVIFGQLTLAHAQYYCIVLYYRHIKSIFPPCLIAIQYNQIPYRCFRPERYRFRGRRLQQQIETLPEDKVHRGNKEQHRRKQEVEKVSSTIQQVYQ